MIYVLSDVLYGAGGVETYLHALSYHLHQKKIPCHVVVAELEHCPLVDELAELGIPVYRQARIPGDRWLVRQRFMLSWLRTRLKPNDWVFCVRQPMPQLYLGLVRMVHRCNAKIAASWMFAPQFLPPAPPFSKQFCQAVSETDAVISVSKCTAHQFKEVYGYKGKVHIVPLHNLLFFQEHVPLLAQPPWKIGYIGRLDVHHKNLDTLLTAFKFVSERISQAELHLYGDGGGRSVLELLAVDLGIEKSVFFHGRYDHRKDLPKIVANCHFFLYPSRFEGGPCFTLLELLQSGRFCVAADVGGIPDLYKDHPEAGLLVSPDSIAEISQGMLSAIEKVKSGLIDPGRIRARYFDGFDMESAHNLFDLALKR